MVRSQLAAPGRDITNARVLSAMGTVPRHEFVPPRLRGEAYDDHPLPIGFEQTISQPYIVAFMTETLDRRPTDKVLEIGTGSGYQAAVLAGLVAEVYSMEIIEALASRARVDLVMIGIPERSGPCGRRLPGGGGAVRCGHRHLCSRSRAGASGRATPGGDAW